MAEITRAASSLFYGELFSIVLKLSFPAGLPSVYQPESARVYVVQFHWYPVLRSASWKDKESLFFFLNSFVMDFTKAMLLCVT
jgi:hypothetical protein